MFKDPQFIITLQMALIGIILIAGFYLIWKAVTRIEEKVDVLLLDKQSQQLFGYYPDSKDKMIEQDGESNYVYSSTDAIKRDADDDGNELMKAIFDNHNYENEDEENDETPNGGFVFFSAPLQMPTSETNDEIINKSADINIEEIKPDITARSDVTISNVGYSKTKLKSMTLDKLKDLCEERQLSAEGTKNELVERLLKV